MAKAAKTKKPTSRKPRYLTAKALGILSEERTALIAFTKADMPADDKVVLNGHVHYYNQCYVEDKGIARDQECGTAGCVAGYVFEHIRVVQGQHYARNRRNASDYISAAVYSDSHLLSDLYRRGDTTTLVTARKVVRRALRTGTVDWTPAREEWRRHHGQ